jgi:hypothetical protein
MSVLAAFLILFSIGKPPPPPPGAPTLRNWPYK